MKKITKLFIIIAAIFAMSSAAISQNTDCLGVTNLASQGVFSDGYIYSFTTVGTDVTVTFELLDDKTGIVAYMQTYNPNFSEVAATNTSGRKFTKTFSGQILGDTFKIACKFAYTGSMVVTKVFTYIVGSSCSETSPDTELPTSFSVNKGAVTYSSVELLLNATDNSGNVIYRITNGAKTYATIGTSGVDKYYTINGLNAATDYAFSIEAKDVSNNAAANSPILVNATTKTNTSTECSGSYTDAQQGSFVNGYNYTFTTSGTDVIVTFELLDSKVGVVAYAWTYNPNFAETKMTLVSGTKFSLTFPDQTLGTTFKAACKFSFSGGMSVTKTLSYTVGNTCGTSTDNQAPTSFTATLGTIGSSSVELLLNATDDSGAVAYTISYGSGPIVVSTSGTSAVQKLYSVKGLTPSTAYSFSVVAKDAAGNAAVNNPIVVEATTTAIPVPSVSAPTPPSYSAAKVISIFSDAFTNVSETNYNPNWGQSTTVSTIQIGSDNVLQYSNLNYQGTQFGSDISAVAMKYLHLDVWTSNETSLQIYCISRKTGEKSVQLTPLNQNAWNSYDIPLTSFTSQGLSLADLFQFKIVGSGGTVVYLDNMYFYDNTASVDTQVPTAFTAAVGTIGSDVVELLLNATDNSGAISYTISYGAGPTILTTIGTSATQKSYLVNGLSASTAYAFSVTAKDATGNTAINSPIMVNATTLTAIPASPTPTVDAMSVKSIYSDSYTAAVTVPSWDNWYNCPITGHTLADNGNTLAFNISTAGVGGTGAFSPIDVSSMTYLHVDIYPTTATTIGVCLVDGSASSYISLGTLIANQWNSKNIALTNYTGFLTAVKQVGFNSPSTGIFYMDNLFFYTNSSTGLYKLENSNSISCYPNPVIDKLTVSAKSEISLVTVRNLLGQTLKSFSVNGLTNSINMSDIPSGNYLVTVKLANGQLSIQKLVKL
ncbi:MAG: T9SS type A sorting domain-containing protein [Paludibacter sp.]|nr:T9SS type A sorting domain-containing protein [Paludibacter sp.]